MLVADDSAFMRKVLVSILSADPNMEVVGEARDGKEAVTQSEALNPDVIIAAWCGAGDRVPLEKIVADREWERTSAALSGRVFCIRDEFLNTPAPTLLQGLDALAWAIHPDVFPRTKGIRQITEVHTSTA